MNPASFTVQPALACAVPFTFSNLLMTFARYGHLRALFRVPRLTQA